MTDAAPPSSPEIDTALRAFDWDQEPVAYATEMLRLAQHRATLASLANSAPEEIAKLLDEYGHWFGQLMGRKFPHWQMSEKVDQARTALLALVAQREEQARRAGYVLAMRLMQSDLWATLDDEERAAADHFLPVAPEEPVIEPRYHCTDCGHVHQWNNPCRGTGYESPHP